MSFLHFRTARRKAKKIVSIRPVHHVPSLPSPGSFTSNDVVEISDAYRSSEPHFGLASPQVDIEFSNEPLFSSDPFVSSTGTYLERAPASDVDEWQNVPPHMPAASSSGESSRSLQDDVGLEPEVHSLPEFGFSDLAVKVCVLSIVFFARSFCTVPPDSTRAETRSGAHQDPGHIIACVESTDPALLRKISRITSCPRWRSPHIACSRRQCVHRLGYHAPRCPYRDFRPAA
ncbi:hypothetical protein BC834DRAFT_77255 [Gloeopeniophorella convolvens]|nr:hypothetical protein BC834DRAFT_77255 [Gloeopeniophorella convolvens]